MKPTTDLIEPGSVLRLDSTTGNVRARQYRVVVASGPDAGKAAVIHGTLFVGTHREAGLRLSDGTVSRYHLEFQAHADGVRARDLDSTNGTFLSGVRVQQADITRETSLAVGKTVLRVLVSEQDLGNPEHRPPEFGKALGDSVAMRRLFGLLERVAVTDSVVVLCGETGTGKEILAEAIHQASPRREKPFVVVDCGALAPTLVESELFGHARGAFTGAVVERAGALSEADGGTLFLDEIGELPLELQPKLLRFLERRTLKRIGEDRPRKIDVRIIAATHRDLEAEAAAGRFRQDLYFRLAVVLARVPPLRERPEDIPLLVHHFVALSGRDDFVLSEELLSRLVAHPWPGNVRELRNLVERVLAGGEIDAAPLPEPRAVSAEAALSSADLVQMPFKQAKERLLDAFTREYIAALLDRCGGNISEVARTAGIARNYVHRLVSRYGLKSTE